MSEEKHICVQNTYNPYENVAGSISGFDSITTSKTGVPVGTHPAPIVSPADVVNALRQLRSIIDSPAMQATIKKLEAHIADTNNPHELNLDDFNQDVIDVLYRAYTANGGVASLAQFQDHVFGKLRTATYNEMMQVADDNLLVNIAGTKRYFDNHENDPEAHTAMIKSQYPGDPVFAEPVIALDASLGLPPMLLAVDRDNAVPYTYVDGDGILRTCDRLNEIPVDWSKGMAAMPCFGVKTNEIEWSEDLTKGTTCINTQVDRSNYTSPDNLRAATRVRSGMDASEVIHKVVFPRKIYSNKEKTFSIYAKAISCRYLSIQFKHMVADTTYVRAQFDLEHGNTLIFNHLNIYRCGITRLADGWWRCEVTQFHEVGNTADIELVFHKTVTSAENAKLSFRAENEELAYLFGAQYEFGHRSSPYIRTVGEAVTRKPPIIMFDVSDQVSNKYAISIACNNPKNTNLKADILPIFSVIGAEDVTIAQAYFLATGAILCSQYRIVGADGVDYFDKSVVSTLTFPSTKYNTVSLGYSVSENVCAVCNNEHLSLDLRVSENAKYLAVGYADDTYLDDYVYSVLMYSTDMSKDELVFVNGDKYLEY